MRRSIVVALLAFGFAGLAVRGFAAGLESERLDVRVPFAFEVGDTTLPPGNYTIQESGDLDLNLLELRSRDASRALFFFVSDVGTQGPMTAKPELVFDRYGDRRFLRTLRLEDGARELVAASPDEVTAARAEAGLRSSATPRR